MLSRCSSRCMLLTARQHMTRCAMTPAIMMALAILSALQSTALAQPYPNRLPPPGWTVHPEVVYPSGYRRTVQSVPTVQRIYMWPQYWPDVPYPADYGAAYNNGPHYQQLPHEYHVAPPSPHLPDEPDSRDIQPPLVEPELPVPSLTPEAVPPPIPSLEPTDQSRFDHHPSRRSEFANRTSERRASVPRHVDIQPRVQSEFVVQDTTPPPTEDPTIQLAPPADRSQLPPARVQPLSSLPDARSHQEPVQSVETFREEPVGRPSETAPVQDAVPPYSAVAEPREAVLAPEFASRGALVPPVTSIPAETVPPRAEPSPALKPELPPIETLSPPSEPTPTLKPKPTPVETLSPPSSEPTDRASEQDAVARSAIDDQPVLRRIEPAPEMEPHPEVAPPNDDEQERELADAEPAEDSLFRVPDVDAGEPDDQIVAAFQPSATADSDEPTLPAQVHDPMEFRITQEQPELQRCPACEDFVEESIDAWVEPCGCCSPVRRTPEMLGDVFLMAQCEEVEVGGGALDASFPALSLGQKIADNNNPLPRHRVYYSFNWFKDAIDYQFNGTGGSAQGRESVYRHTAGIEIPFACNAFSVEVRAPIEQRVTGRQDIGPDSFFYNFAGLGNVLINTKALLGETEHFAWSAGVGIELPTGRDSSAGINQFVVHIENEAVHLHPYIAMVWTPTQKLFIESFTQLDVTTRGNLVTLEDRNLATTETLGRLTSSRILFVDAMAGYWWYCDDPCRRIHSLASLVEVHYVTSLDPGESLEGNTLGGDFFVCNGAVHNGGIDTVNLTLGLHAEFGHCSAIRIGGAFPVTDRQLFDSELIFQWNRRL